MKTSGVGGLGRRDPRDVLLGVQVPRQACDLRGADVLGAGEPEQLGQLESVRLSLGVSPPVRLGLGGDFSAHVHTSMVAWSHHDNRSPLDIMMWHHDSTSSVERQEYPLAVSKRLRTEILRRDDSTCQKCGSKAPAAPLVVDHVIPVTLGGSDEPSNLQTLCEPCNSGKSATPPDAAVVAKVAEDAERWSKAIKASADKLLAAHGAESQVYAQVNQWWSEAPYGRRALLPPGWERSIDSFFAAGLPMPLIKDSLEIALSRQRNDPWRYFCAVAWKKVRELQEAAKSLVHHSQDDDDEEEDEEYDPNLDPKLAPGRESLAATILGTLAEDAADIEARIERERIWVEEGDAPRSKLIIEAAETAVGQASWDSLRLMAAANDLLGLFPRDEVDEARAEAAAKVDEALAPGEPARKTLVVIETVRTFLLRRALDYLEAMPEQERAEWMVYADAWHGPASPWDESAELPPDKNVMIAAKLARAITAGRLYHSMCLGEGTYIPRCPARATFRVYFQELACCSSDADDEHLLHGFCSRHLEDAVEHGWTAPTGRPLTIRDFEELDAT